jgi:hypothetical protein
MGRGQMSSDNALVRELAARVGPALVLADERYGDMWDLDEVFWEAYARPWDISRAIDAFRYLVGSYAEWASHLVATLVINLRQSPTLDHAAPNPLTLDALDVSQDHPPSIGFGKVLRPASITYEHYRVPINQQFVVVTPGEVRAYYECWRTAAAMQASEPYDRALVFQHWNS